MRFSKLLAASSIAVCLSVSSIFAAPVLNNDRDSAGSDKKIEIRAKDKKDFDGKGFKHKHGREGKFSDPVKALEGKKEMIRSMVKEGKITKEKADAIITKIDVRIKEVNEFNKLPLQQKKDKLLSNFKARIEEKVQEGKLPREKANEIIKKVTEKIEKWDGNGYPHFDKRKLKK